MEDIINALKNMESELRPIKENNLLKNDGKPNEKGICIALKNIYEIKEEETVHWNTIRNAFREVDKPISSI